MYMSFTLLGKPPQKAKKGTSRKKKNGSSVARSSRRKTSKDDEESLEEALEFFGFGPAPSRPYDDELFDYPTSRAAFSRPGKLLVYVAECNAYVQYVHVIRYDIKYCHLAILWPVYSWKSTVVYVIRAVKLNQLTD